MDSIKEDIKWLGFDWAGEYYASDYFQQLYDWAVVLIKKGLAYVDDQTQEEIRQNRGTVQQPRSGRTAARCSSLERIARGATAAWRRTWTCSSG